MSLVTDVALAELDAAFVDAQAVINQHVNGGWDGHKFLKVNQQFTDQAGNQVSTSKAQLVLSGASFYVPIV